MQSAGQWALVLAGGDGTRLREFTRALTGHPIPKQYCRIVGDRSLLERTLDRIAPVAPPERTLVIVNRDHLPLARPQLGSVPAENVIVQPRNCDTGPGLVLSLLALARRAPDARVAVFPSDHWVADEGAFVAAVARALGVVGRLPRKMALIGIPPEHPEPDLGYIEPGPPLEDVEDAGAFHVAAFREKPTPEMAGRIARGGGLWNSFVMAFCLRPVLRLLARRRPVDFGRMRDLRKHPERIEEAYGEVAPWNFSGDFLARIPRHLVVLRAERTGWSDWGTPQAIVRTLAPMPPRLTGAVRAIA
jgi:mannose-1-phosphate guanylyltransferase